MKTKNIVCTCLALGLAGNILPNLRADEGGAKPSPEAAAKITEAIKAAFPDATIDKMGKESEDGISFYEVNLKANGVKIDADVTSDGTLIETEESAEMKAFPKAAQDALKKATKGMKVSGGEITKTYAKPVKDDSTGDTQVIHVVKLSQPTTAYEVDVAKGGQEGEFAVDADGKILESPKWAKSAEKSKEKDDEDD